MGKNQKLILIVVLAVLLRLVNLSQSFWLDEASQAQLSQLSVAQIWLERQADFHPPLFYILAHFWMIMGKSEVWLRLLPVTFGVLAVVAIYRLAKLIIPGEKYALLAAFILAINPYHIYYSQEFRMYSLVFLLAIVSVSLLIQKSKFWFIVTSLMLYTHYLSVLFILFEIIYVLAVVKNKKWLVGQLFLSGALFLFWLPQFLQQYSFGRNIDNSLPGWRQVLSLPAARALPEIIFKFAAGRINIFPRIVYYVYVVFVLAVTAFSVVMAKTKRNLMWTWLFVPIISSILISPFIPQTQSFRLIFVLPALILVFAQSCLKYPRLMLTLLIYIAIVGNVLYFTRSRLQREQWRQAIEFLEQQDGQIVVKSSDKFSTFIWYSPNLPVLGAVPSSPPEKTEVIQRLAQVNQSGVYLLEYLTDLTDPSRVVEEALTELGYKQKKIYNFSGVGFIYHYVK